MIIKINIEAYLIKCEGHCCADYLIIPNEEIHLNLKDEIISDGWTIKNGKHYCGVCQNER